MLLILANLAVACEPNKSQTGPPRNGKPFTGLDDGTISMISPPHGRALEHPAGCPCEELEFLSGDVGAFPLIV